MELFESILSNYSWGMWATKMTHISEGRIDEEWELPKIVWQIKDTFKRYLYEVLWWNKTCLCRNNASGIGVETRLLHIREGMNLSMRQRISQQHPKANSIHQQRPIICRRKTQKHRERCISDITWTRDISPLYLCQRGEYNHKTQANGSNLWERCSNTTAETSVHTIKIHQYRLRILYKPGLDLFLSRLVFLTKSWREQGQQNTQEKWTLMW